VDAPALARQAEPAPPARDIAAEAASNESAASELQMEIRKLSERIDELRREQSEKPAAPLVNIEVLRAELAAMSRCLADLAPRNAVVALEGAIRDLSQRVAASRENGARGNLLAPVEGLVAELRESLRAHDPRQAVEALQREIGGIAAKVDGIAQASISPAAFERIRQQTEEARNLLAALAQRPVPLDRLERQIGVLADRVDRLSTSPAPHAESAEVVASLAEARAQVERSTPASALASIERRLEQIASRMDQALEHTPKALLDTAPLEEAMREISAKLDRPSAIDPNAFQSMITDLGARIDRRVMPVIDTAPLEQVLRKLSERPIAVDTEPLAGMMREISAKLDKPSPPAVDTGTLEQMLHSLRDKIDENASPQFTAERIDHAVEVLSQQIAARGDAAPDIGVLEALIRGLEQKFENARAGDQAQALDALSAQIADMKDRLDASPAKPSSIGALEAMVAELLDQLDQTQLALRNVSPPPVHAAGGEEALVQSLEDLRAEQNHSDRRIQSTLGGVSDMLEALVDRIGQIEEGIARAGQGPRDAADLAPSSPARQSAAAAAPVNAALRSLDATIREAPVFAPARVPAESRPERAPDARAPQFAPSTSMRSIEGSDFLIEPGAGAPIRALEKDAIAAGPKGGVNAHIAAARRAAQAALAETANNIAKDGAKPSPGGTAVLTNAGGIEQAKAFFAARRRPILLGVALFALIAIVAVELGVMRQPNMQKSESDPIVAPNLTSAEAPKDAAAAPGKSDARAVDPTPVGSISAAPGAGPTTKFLTPAPAELVASIPPAAPQGLREAAAAGDPAAQFELAARLAEGRNLTRDPHAAGQWFERAAAQGLAPAQYRLGSLYEKGLGVTRDAPLAKAWYKKAAEAGNARAMHNLAVLIAEGAGIKPDYTEAADWFQKAALLGVKDSQYNLAILYARGMGVGQDLGQAWLYFSLAAQQGDLDSAKKRDEVAAKMDAKTLAADATALANFRAATPVALANEVPAPAGGWDFGKTGAPQAAPAQPAPPPQPTRQPQASNLAPHTPHSTPM
jgi:localization factor PodJL